MRLPPSCLAPLLLDWRVDLQRLPLDAVHVVKNVWVFVFFIVRLSVWLHVRDCA